MGKDTSSGVIFDLQRFCVNDGAGIRTTIFLKGCPLKCKWCHNPESQKVKQELRYKAVRCVGCGACVDVCPNSVHTIENTLHIIDFEKCTACGKCLEYCCYDALEICGKAVSVNELVSMIEIDKPYYKDNGGVTLSGGEPMMQADFVEKLSCELQKQGISVFMETCGYATTIEYNKVLPYIDCFLFDWKVSDPDLHLKMTGVPNGVILESLSYLNDQKKKIVLRCPIIPDVNLNSEHFRNIAELQHRFHFIDHVELLAYHTMGESKKSQIGRGDIFEARVPSKEETKLWLDELKKYGCEKAIIG